MNQSAIIGGALLGGFALFLAARDRLPNYGRIFWGAKPASHAPVSVNPETPTEGGSIVGPGSILDNLGPNIDLKSILDIPQLPSIPDMGAYGF